MIINIKDNNLNELVSPYDILRSDISETIYTLNESFGIYIMTEYKDFSRDILENIFIDYPFDENNYEEVSIVENYYKINIIDRNNLTLVFYIPNDENLVPSAILDSMCCYI